MTVTAAADELRTNLVGAWTLRSYETTSLDGSDTIYPLGEDARGIIMYTPDGYMSAQIMRPERTAFGRNDPHQAEDDELAAAAAGYFNYAGPYTVTDDVIAHHVELSLVPNWVGGTQYRKARLADSRLELSSAEPILMRGKLRNAKLVWCRA
jgi:Lipocalin-like domain